MEDATLAPTNQTHDVWTDSEVSLRNFTDTFVFKEELSNNTKPSSLSPEVYKLMIVGMILSVICLILIIVVYGSTHELRNTHGKNVMSLSTCLLVTYLLLCLEFPLRRHLPHYVCFSVAVIIQAMFLASFFWTNVMTYNVYKKIFSMKVKSEVKRSSRKYLKYSIYAWSATILATLPAVVLELSNLVPPEDRPKFGVNRCWLSGQRAFSLYFNLPAGFILLGNLVMFIVTIRRLFEIKKTTVVLKVEKQQQKLCLYFKLFLVMGIVWFSEFLPWISGVYSLYSVAGIMTTLDGVFLFVIFVLNRRIFHHLGKRFSGKNMSIKFQKSWSSEQTMCTSVSSTSHWYGGSKE